MILIRRSHASRRLVEVLLACVLLSAVAAKTYQFCRGIPSPLLLILQNRIVLVLAIQAELALGMWLLAGGFSRARFYLTISCFALFSCVAGWEALESLPSCGCFGEIRIPPWLIASFDVAAVVALWLTRPRRAEAERTPHLYVRFAGAALVGVVVSAILWGGLFLNSSVANGKSTLRPTSGAVVLRPEDWLNQTCPLLDVIDGSAEVRRGQWCLFLYHYDCPICLKVLPAYTEAAATSRQRGGPRFGFLAVPSFPDDAEDPVPASPEYQRWKLPADRQWFVTTPTVIRLKDGRVTAIAQGEEALKFLN